MEEKKAISLLKQGDIRGLEVLAQTYQVRAVRAAFIITGDKALAEDVVQDSFLYAYEHISTFDESRSFAPWFFRSVVHRAIKYSRQNSKYVTLDEDVLQQSRQYTNANSSDLEQVIEQSLNREVLIDALNKLSPEQRAVVVMRYYLNLSETDITARQEIPVGTVKWRLYAARERLKEMLSPLFTKHVNEASPNKE